MPELNDLMQWMDPTNWGFGALDARTVVVAIGAALIVAGSRLYRLMILSPGMVGGVLLSHHYAPAGDDVTKLAMTVGVGLIGASSCTSWNRRHSAWWAPPSLWASPSRWGPKCLGSRSRGF